MLDSVTAAVAQEWQVLVVREHVLESKLEYGYMAFRKSENDSSKQVVCLSFVTADD